jgi:hypothetical protein
MRLPGIDVNHYRRWESNPHGRSRPEDFKSSASAIPPRRQVRGPSRPRDRRRQEVRGSHLNRHSVSPSTGAGAFVRDPDFRGLRFWQAEGVGFEPTDGLHHLRFSRPSRSTTLAPLLLETTRDARTAFQTVYPWQVTVNRPRQECRRRRRSAHRPSQPERSRRWAANPPRRALLRAGSAAWRNTCARAAR